MQKGGIMSKYQRTKILPKGLQFIQGVVRGNTRFEITRASFGVTQVSEQTIVTNGAIPNSVGNIPITAIDDDSLADQGVLGVELSFTQKSTGIDHDVDLWDVQIEGRQERDSADKNYPIAFTVAEKPEALTLSDPSFEFRLMVYVQVGDTDDVTVNVSPDGMESRGEHQRDMQKLVDDLANGYVEANAKDKNGNQLYDHNHNAVTVRRAVVATDRTLTQDGKAADALIAGEFLRSLDKNLTNLDQEIHKDFAKKTEDQATRNLALANADSNRSQDQRLSKLELETSELENNNRDIKLVGHDGTAITTHTRTSVIARKQLFVVDSTLTNYSALANAGAVGAAINQNYLMLNQSINTVIADLNSLERNDYIITLANRLAAAEAIEQANQLKIQDLESKIDELTKEKK